MSENKLNITPETKVAALLKAYPQLESLLLELSPSFVALKNPVLRRTVAAVTSLQQAAKVGGIDPIGMVNALRCAVGLAPLQECYANELEVPFSTPRQGTSPRPKVTKTVDARPLLAEGTHPKDLILKNADELQPGDCMEFIAPFPPNPLIELLQQRGFVAEMEMRGEGDVRTYIYREA